MNITQQLFDNGDRFGFMVEDGEDTYAIPLEGLYVSTIYKNLVASGYKLLSKSEYEMIANGIKLSQLPIVEAKKSDYEKDFANMLRLPMETEFVVEDEAEIDTGITVEYPVQYTITTRAAFLEYLDSIKDGVGDYDFMPINSFVSPSARFTFDELASGKINSYLDTIEKRRRMSYNRYKYLKAWVAELKGRKMEEIDYSVVDEVYQSYGVEGFNFIITNKEVHYDRDDPLCAKHDFTSVQHGNVIEAVDADCRATQEVLSGFYRRFTCLTNSDMSDVIYPADIKVSDAYKQKPVFAELFNVKNSFAALPKDTYAPVDFIMSIKRKWYKYTTNDGVTIIITPIQMLISGVAVDEFGGSKIIERHYAGFRVVNPAIRTIYVDIDDWDRGEEFFIEQAKLAASIGNIYKNRVPGDVQSCYDLLIEMGLTPSESVKYVANTCGFFNRYNLTKNSDKNAEDKEDNTLVMLNDIEEFFRASTVAEASSVDLPTYAMRPINTMGDASGLPYICEDGYGDRVVTGQERIDTIIDIMHGDVGPGDAAATRDSLLHPDIRPILRVLRAAINCLGIPSMSIINTCNEFAKNSVRDYAPEDVPTSLTLENNGKKIIVERFARPYDVTLEVLQLKGKLLNQRLDNANVFYEVDDVAYEATNDPRLSKRHVGIHGVACNMCTEPISHTKQEKMRTIIAQLINDYIEENGDNAMSQAGLKTLARRTILAMYKNDGVLKFADDATGIPASWRLPWTGRPDWAKTISDRCYYFEDSLLNVCNNSIRPTVNKGPIFNHVCLNATVMPNRVIPNGSGIIHEVPLRLVVHISEIKRVMEGKMPECTKYYAPYFTNENCTWFGRGHRHLLNICKGNDGAEVYDSDIYSDIRTAFGNALRAGDGSYADTLKAFTDAYAEVAAKSPRHAELIASDLAFHFYINFYKVAAENVVMLTPPYPASVAFPFCYPEREQNIEFDSANRKTFRPSTYGNNSLYVVGGPDVEDDVVRPGLPYAGHNITKNAVTAPLPQVSHGSAQITRMTTLDPNDLFVNDGLAMFADDKRATFAIKGKTIALSLNGEIKTYKPEELFTISEQEAPIYHINKYVHYLYDLTHTLYRIEVPYENYSN